MGNETSKDIDRFHWKNIEQGADARILIVDDDDMFLHLCKSYLKHSSGRQYAIVTANTVRQAHRALEVDSFECVLIDYHLPDGSGIEIISRLKEVAGTSSPGTIVLTGETGETAAVEALKAGADDFLTKCSFNKFSLCRALDNAVDKHRLRQMHLSRFKELETANSLLRSRNAEIQRFYHTVSHEVKTPLTAIREFVSIVHDGLAGEVCAEQKTILNYALQSCNQIKNQFDELLELSQFETGKMVVDLQPQSIHEVFDHCIVSGRPTALAKNIELKILDEYILPQVMMQSSRIIQVLSNLITNALKFTPEGGEVTIGAEIVNGGDHIRLSVTDTGCGIPAEDLPHIFERLYQVTPSSDLKNETGMGLGLSIASQIIKLHGSHIEVQSTPDKGSCFSFELNTARIANKAA